MQEAGYPIGYPASCLIFTLKMPKNAGHVQNVTKHFCCDNINLPPSFAHHTVCFGRRCARQVSRSVYRRSALLLQVCKALARMEGFTDDRVVPEYCQLVSDSENGPGACRLRFFARVFHQHDQNSGVCL